MQDYHPEVHWSRVGEAIRQRGTGNVIAGDDAPYYRHLRRTFLRRFLDPIDVRGKVVLEVGCGPGGNLRYLAGRGPRKIIGVDISQAMLNIAASTVHNCENVVLHKTDGTVLPLPDLSVDIALTITVLQHNTDNEMFNKLTGEICRVTRDLVVLSEAVGVGHISKDGSWVDRPIQDYRLAMARGGFVLKRCDYLRTGFSRRMHRRIARLLAPHHKEGEPFPLTARLALSAAMPVTRMLDPLLAPFFSRSIGLARMEFIRN